MTKVKLNLASGMQQERELITSFIVQNIKYVIFDGESTGSMGLPIILVGKEDVNKIVGVTDAEEWKLTKDTLKQIIAGENVTYAHVNDTLNADDIFYRQLTLPIASFDILKSSYVDPGSNNGLSDINGVDASIFDSVVAPAEVTNPMESFISNPVSSVAEDTTVSVEPVNVAPIINENPNIDVAPAFDAVQNSAIVSASDSDNNASSNDITYENMKADFLKEAEELFNKYFEKFNHID